MTRRSLLAVFPFARVLAANYMLGSRLSDGSMFFSGFRNGYACETVIKSLADGTIQKFEATITARRDVVAEALLSAAGYTPVYKSGFTGLSGGLVVRVEDVEGDFNLLVDGQLFLNEGVGTKRLTNGQKLTVRALPGAKLSAK